MSLPLTVLRGWRHLATLRESKTHFGLHWVRPWDNRGKCYMDGKRIQCWSDASLHITIYLQPFLRYSKLLVENCDIFIPPPLLSAPAEGARWNFVKMFDAGKTRMIGLPYGEKTMTIMLSRFHTIPAYYGQTDGRTE